MMILLFTLAMVWIFLGMMTGGVMLIGFLFLLPFMLIGAWLEDVDKDKNDWEDK